MKLKSIVVDDEFNSRNNLKLLIDEFCPQVEVLGMAGSAKEARLLLKKYAPQIVFLDIKMPGEDGFEFLNSIEKRNFSVVFTTAYEEFALQAFREDAIDYLEKPISIEDLQKAVKKVYGFHYNEENSNATDEQLIKKLIRQTSASQEKITIPTRDGFLITNTEEIVHLEASEGYTLIYFSKGKKVMSSKHIKVYEDILSTATFFRTHKSHIINFIDHLLEFRRTGGNVAVMSNGREIPVSRRRMNDFLQLFNS